MTTIAYKDGILAGDRQSNYGSLPAATTKIHRHGKWVAGACGNTAQIAQVHKWVADGMDPSQYPAFQNDPQDAVTMLLASAEGLFVLDCTPVPYKIEQPFFAIGSGRDFAIAAMDLGLNAVEAVHLASKFDTTTGLGVDAMTVEGSVVDATIHSQIKEDKSQEVAA